MPFATGISSFPFTFFTWLFVDWLHFYFFLSNLSPGNGVLRSFYLLLHGHS